LKHLNYYKFYIRSYGRFFWAGLFFLALTNVLDVIPPLIIMKGVDQIIAGESPEALMRTALLFFGITVCLAIFRFHWRMQFGKFHHNVALHLRQRIFDKLTNLGPSFYSKNPIGELMSLITNDVEAVRMGMGPGLLILVDALLYFITIPPIMLAISVPLTFKTLIFLPVLPFFINWLSGVIHRRFLQVQDKFSDLSGLTQENITGIRVIKSYVQEENQIERFNKASRSWQEANLKVAWAETWMHPVMEFSLALGIVALLFLGSRDVVAGAITIGGFVALHRYITKMVWPVTAVGWAFSLISQGKASLDRLDEFLNQSLDVWVDPVAEHKNPLLQGPIEIRGLSFRYPHSERWALKDISLRIEPGETIGIVGPVGSGKTTLAQLLCHLYQVPDGKIFINGIDLNHLPMPVLRQHVSLVPQDAFLFSSSITENMSFGIDTQPGLEVLKKVAQIAKLDEEIESLPQRYDTFLGERGINLSGGQKQRMTITRALLRKSPVIIFDDSLSAVDSETESLILNRLREETQRHTTIIISHRLSTLSLCQRILVLKDGEIEAVGTPDELRRTSATYSEFFHLQGYR
jgi:ATP-binding cassette, subfamily B, multidrug efflux pump